MKNYYGGMDDELDNEMIMISDTCLNESDSENDLPEEKSKYLSILTWTCVGISNL